MEYEQYDKDSVITELQKRERRLLSLLREADGYVLDHQGNSAWSLHERIEEELAKE